MKNYTLNIGLNNNPMNETEILKRLVHSFEEEPDWRVETGIYKGETEKTLVVRGFSGLYYSDFCFLVETLCTELTQECIPFIYEGGGELVYNKSFKGNKMKFDINYFLTIKN